MCGPVALLALASLMLSARSWLVGRPAASPLRAAWAATNGLLRSKLVAAGILADSLACWRAVFSLGNSDPDDQDVEAAYDLYAAGGKRCLLSCNDSGQQRPFIFKLDGEELAAYSNFLAMDGAAAGRGRARFSPYSHGRHDAEKRKLGASIQWDFFGTAAPGGSGGSVPGRGILKTQTGTNFFGDGDGLWDSRERNAATAASTASQHLQPRERLERRFASSAAGGPGPAAMSTAISRRDADPVGRRPRGALPLRVTRQPLPRPFTASQAPHSL
jgi:hypothetical protein